MRPEQLSPMLPERTRKAISHAMAQHRQANGITAPNSDQNHNRGLRPSEEPMLGNNAAERSAMERASAEYARRCDALVAKMRGCRA